jgi:hypothetical protein
MASSHPMRVIAGLDPAIHTAIRLEFTFPPTQRHLSMDARVKPAHDD